MSAAIWFRNDLRLVDNPAVAAALANCTKPLKAFYLVAPKQWQQHYWAPIKLDLLWRHLAQFKADLKLHDIELELLECPHWHQAPRVINDFCQTHQITDLYANAEYPLHEQQRDRAVENWLAEQHISLHMTHGQLIAAPTIRTKQGGIYQKFTPFHRAWREQIRVSGLPECPQIKLNEAATPAAIGACPLPTKSSEAWPVGEVATLALLDRYIENHVANYADERDLPGLDTTSRLSAYFELGIVGVVTAAKKLQQLSPQFPDGLEQGADIWLAELAWREFYQHLMAHVPRLSQGKAFQAHTDAFPWRTGEQAEADFARWCRGETGFPIVDAGMRQLNSTGWMHNRVRMIVASFLVKDLQLDWRWGERYFMENLIDGSFPANNGGWQWSASTGVDAVPYFRVFNPTSQSQKVDPDGRYIRTWIKELENCPSKYIHAPSEWLRANQNHDYPLPMVDHKQAREQFLEKFKAL
ncbi:cryptochrome/photolyase family protein [Pseudidiomarina taiwanensis]|uniref:Deoxyribodipyrimidine photo-lyase n=1 Tax=Pseudidiomarina taiwanensis TaxID=337250 RepID=A0A432ZMZ7_9GAMM|nr:FAD-binding domain-containing protein [Pseudidiomarina taiwanensis]RUO79250.1 deoxyribodipyrimidine photo-lyase [Pseudidiomarina taiwanensis]